MSGEIERYEEKTQASYGMRSSLSRGRVYKETEHPYRSIYQRDRDRIIHSAAFRRLEYKTQVFVNHEGDYFRTRLTHTLEVSQIARTIARSLRLNEDLVEAISLAHDLGHTPFGHSGEEALSELMKDEGGFNHNLQGLRVVDILEERYPDFKGLNLSWEVREGIVRHSTSLDFPQELAEFQQQRFPLLETQVVDIADEIAYDNHDLDDGIASGLIDEQELVRIPLWSEVYKQISKQHPQIGGRIGNYQIIRMLINVLSTDLIEESERRLKDFCVRSPEDARGLNEKVIRFSPRVQEMRFPLKDFLREKLYRHYRVVRMADKARRFIQDLFKLYLERPEALPPSIQERLKTEAVSRVICDYIAGMTDRYALDEYKKLFDPYEKV